MPPSKQKKQVAKKPVATRKKTPGNLKKHFGKSKEGIDGLAFQKKVRSEWD